MNDAPWMNETAWRGKLDLNGWKPGAAGSRLANQTEYGLSAAVISRSIGRAMAIGNRLHTGLLHINDQTVHDEPHIPFGGRGASGNGGRIGGPANWEEFTQWQWVTIKDSPPRYLF